MTKHNLSLPELWQCMIEAETRQRDSSLPLDVRIRSAETANLCLQAAGIRGYSYEAFRKSATKELNHD